MRILFLIPCLFFCGCFQHRTIAGIAANTYAAAEAITVPHSEIVMPNAMVEVTADYLAMLKKISIAERLNAIQISKLCGYTIQGADTWMQSLPPSLQLTGQPTPPAP